MKLVITSNKQARDEERVLNLFNTIILWRNITISLRASCERNWSWITLYVICIGFPYSCGLDSGGGTTQKLDRLDSKLTLSSKYGAKRKENYN